MGLLVALRDNSISPSGIAINRTGYVFVVDSLNDRIHVLPQRDLL